MSQQTLQDLLGDILKDHQEAFEQAARGDRPTSSWDGPPLPLELEYRVEVDTSVFKTSNAGREQIAMTFVVLEPEEYAGRKFQDYYAPKAGNEVGARQFAQMVGAFQGKMDGWDNDWDGFASQFEGKTGVVALRVWGQDNDRFGVRWINADRGQALSTNVKPPRPQSKKLVTGQADIVIPKAQEAVSTVTPPIVVPTQGESIAPKGVNLPPGLRT